MKLRIVYILLSVCLSMVACNRFYDECTYASGEKSTRIIELQNFSAIMIYDIFKIYLIQDSLNFIEAVGPENTLDQIDIEQPNDTISLYNHANCRFLREYDSITLNIHFTNLEFLELIEPSDIVSRDTIFGERIVIFSVSKIGKLDLIIDYDYIRFDNSYKNVGEYSFSGKANYLRIFANYGAYVYAQNLIAQNVDIFLQTKAEVHVYPIDNLKLWWWDKSELFIYNTPTNLEVMEEIAVGETTFLTEQP